MTPDEQYETSLRVFEELVSRQLLHKMLIDFGDSQVRSLFETLMKNGCPAKAILRTLGEKKPFR